MPEIKHDVFRFVAIRPPVMGEDEQPPEVLRDERPLEKTYVGRAMAEIGERRSHDLLLRVLAHRAGEDGLDADLPDTAAGAAIAAVGDVVRRAQAEATVDGLAEAVEQALGATPADFVGSDDATALRAGLWDRLETHYLLARLSPRSLERLVGAILSLHLVDELAAGTEVNSLDELVAIVRRTLVLPDTDIEIDPPDPTTKPRTEAQRKADEAALDRHRKLWAEVVELNEALGTVRTARTEVATRRVKAEEAEPVLARDEEGREGPQVLTPAAMRRVARLPEATLGGLPGAARRIIEALPKGDDLTDQPRIVAGLEQRLAQLSQQIFTSTDPLLIKAMPPEAANVPGMQVFAYKYAEQPQLDVTWAKTPVAFPWVYRPKIKPLGIGDLKVVKEKLLRYVAGEVAHIENVLDGEKKERTHRRLDRTEETLTIETEVIEETEKDSQTTDRFEMKKETEKTIQTDLSVDAGVTVSASYGPVELGAYANFAYSQSTTETTRNAQNFARDVVDRSLTKIQKRAREERVSKTLKEIEETNLHGIDNSPAGNGHVTGIYRWVDKEYEAQVYNYGKRMMFEFVLPEPAAYYFYAQENDPGNKLQVEKPPELGFLTHKDVQPWNFGDYVRAYHVQGVSPPPPEWKVLPATFDQNGMTDDQSTSKSSKDLVVPDGYVAKSFGWHWNTWGPDDAFFNVLVGLDAVNGTDGNLSDEDTVVPVSVISAKVKAYIVNVEVWARRTDRAFESWQIATFEKIVAAYQAAKAMYEDKLKAAEVARGVIIEGRNPGINQEIIRNELKKQSITMITGDDYSQFNAVSGLPPVVDLQEAVEEGQFIQFFEQAFEWEQLTYVFYPYFWSRQSTWNQRVAFNDKDPRFNQFLQAGAARVVVPVHPAYNDAILHYVETGAIWNGGTPPHLDDPLFISIVEELKAATDDLEGAVPEGEPWAVKVPTSLVYLQHDATLPDYTQ
jgi:hypothetical protein